MINSEILENITYRYDTDNYESNINVESDNVDVAGNLTVHGYFTTSTPVNAPSADISGSVSCKKLTVSNEFRPLNLFLTSKNKAIDLNADQLVNHQFYYHCVKITNTTKTAYVNVYSSRKSAVADGQDFYFLVQGNIDNTVDWYYGAGDHVVHCYHDASGEGLAKFVVMIDNERATAFEDHFNPIFNNTDIVA